MGKKIIHAKEGVVCRYHQEDIKTLLDVIADGPELKFSAGISKDNHYSRLKSFLRINREPLRSLDNNSLIKLYPLLQNGYEFLQKNVNVSQHSSKIRNFIPQMRVLAA